MTFSRYFLEFVGLYQLIDDGQAYLVLIDRALWHIEYQGLIPV
jgi:hypothetical protein